MRGFVFGFISALVLGAVLSAAAGYFFVLRGSDTFAEREPTTFASVEPLDSLPDVQAHSNLFEQRIEEPAPGVHVAIGYGLANVILIEADEGLILVDTLESIRAAQGLKPWLDQMRASTGKDITDLIYTHNHADHVFGAGVLLEGQTRSPRIWAQALTQDRVHEVVSVLTPITFKRAMRMFGTYLPDDSFSNNGIGPRLLNDDQDGVHFLLPTHTVGDQEEVTMAGERVILRHAPGETLDQLLIYLPERGVLLPADNYYHAFPNLYTIRGTPYRDPRLWVASLDAMRGFAPDVMIPQHSQPVVGAEEIEKRLRNYRDAIQYVHDETIRLINEGLSPDQIAEVIELPPHLAREPYLQEFYGRVEWAARAVFAGTLGWFSGDPVDLLPVGLAREAELMRELAGGADELYQAAQGALAKGEFVWALGLARHLAQLGDDRAASLQAQALRELAAREISSSGRNYFLTMAAEAEGFEIPKNSIANTPAEVLNGIPIENFMVALATNLRASENFDIEVAYGFNFTDEAPLTIRIRRGVAVIEEGLADDVVGTLTTSTDNFRAMAIDRANAAALLLGGEISVEGAVTELTAFLARFNPPSGQ
ncbi:MAG: alkyl sulfatase dimerization domain-containing protein [Alphaproteobacteria bacterium]